MKRKPYISSAVCALSLFFGVFALLLGWAFSKDLLSGILCGLGISLLSAVLIPLYAWTCDRRYRDIEDDIPEEILLKEQIDFSFPQSGRGGYICVTPEALYFFSRDRKPHFSFRLPKEAMLSAEFVQGSCLRLSVYDHGAGQATVLALLTPRGGEILSVLIKSGWIYCEN